MSETVLALALDITTALVILGVFLEGAEFLEEVKENGWQLNRPLKLAAKLGFVVLVLGLAGEWYFSTMI